MIRRTIAWAVFVAALLLLTLPGYFLQERMTEPTHAEVHNNTADHIWLAYDLGERRAVLLELDADDTGPVCYRDASHVYVYETDPAAEPKPTPVATVDFDGEDLCDGAYRWDGSTLSQVP